MGTVNDGQNCNTIIWLCGNYLHFYRNSKYVMFIIKVIEYHLDINFATIVYLRYSIIRALIKVECKKYNIDCCLPYVWYLPLLKPVQIVDVSLVTIK